MNKLFVIVRHDEMDNCRTPYYYVENEDEAIAAVKHLNETEGVSVTLEDDGSVADICDDDAIYYSYTDVEHYQPKK